MSYISLIHCNLHGIPGMTAIIQKLKNATDCRRYLRNEGIFYANAYTFDGSREKKMSEKILYDVVVIFHDLYKKLSFPFSLKK